MREIRLSGSEGGVGRKPYPYPYFSFSPYGTKQLHPPVLMPRPDTLKRELKRLASRV